MIFSADAIASQSSDFSSINTPDYYGKKEILENWIQRAKVGRLKGSNEDEIKPEFINDIFGKILGFSDFNTEWFIKHEAKTKLDGSKPDAALGYFNKDNIKHNDVRAVIEMKGPGADLDKKNRATGKSAIDQAFEYAPKMGRRCAWVIVSNFLEIRFYSARDRTVFQVYHLLDLEDAAKLDEMLFLFQKDNLMQRDDNSRTNRLYEYVSNSKVPLLVPKHIIDQLYYSIKRFSGLEYVDPKYLCKLRPFNILNEHVWHYDNHTLYTLNNDIFDLLSSMHIEDEKVILSSAYIAGLKKSRVKDAEEKLFFVFKMLNKSGVRSITAMQHYHQLIVGKKYVQDFLMHTIFNAYKDECVTRDIEVYNPTSCDCMSCNFRAFDFNRLFDKLEAAKGELGHFDMELAYGNYLTASGDYKTAYTVLRRLEKYKYKEGKTLNYFLVKLNLKYLYNLIKGSYDGGDKDQIMDYLRSIDIDSLIHNELDLGVDSDVRNYLIQIKEDRLINNVKEKIRGINHKTVEVKQRYDNGGSQIGGLDLVNQIQENYHKLYLHVNRNFIVQNIFKDYREITTEVFKSLVNNHETPKVGLREFNDFFIHETILHVPPTDLAKILKDVKVLRIRHNCLKTISVKFLTFFSSFYSQNGFSFEPQPNGKFTSYLQNFNFKRQVCDIFSNIILILSKGEFSKEEFEALKGPLLLFLKTEDMLAHYDLKWLEALIRRKGNLFLESELLELLSMAIARDRYNNIKYNGLIRNVSLTIEEFYPDFKISNKALIKKAIANAAAIDGKGENFGHLIFLLKVTDGECTILLSETLNYYLAQRFDEYFYERLLRHNIHHYLNENFFLQYLLYLSKKCNVGRVFKNGRSDDDSSDWSIYSFKMIICDIGVILSDREKALFSGSQPYERWLIDPLNFDYAIFEPYWITDLPIETKFFNELREVPAIANILKESLTKQYDNELGQRYVRHFLS